MANPRRTFWVTTSKITINETNQKFIYGDAFPDMEDERRTDRLLEAGMISKTRPTDIPAPPILETNHFEPSQPYVAPPVSPKKKETIKKKDK